MNHSTFNADRSTARASQPRRQATVESSKLNVERSPSASSTADLRALAREPEGEKRNRRFIWACSVCALFGAAALLGLLNHEDADVAKPSPRRTAIVPVAFIAQAPSATKSGAPDSKPLTSKTSEINQAPQVEPAVIPLDPNGAQPPVPTLQPAPENPLPADPAPAQIRPVASQFEPSKNPAFTPQPAYPSVAQRRGQQGTVRIGFKVEPSGRLVDVRIGQASGYVLLDEAALAAVRDEWRFPAGPVRHHFVDIVFQLK